MIPPMNDFLKPLLQALIDAMSPLRVGFSNAQEYELFLANLGWDAGIDEDGLALVRNTVRLVWVAEIAIDNIVELVESLESEGEASEDIASLLETAMQLINAIQDTASQPTDGLPFPLDQPAFWDEIGEHLLEFLLVSYLERKQPLIFAFFHLTGIIEFERLSPPNTGRLNYTRSNIHWDRLPEFFKDPAGLINHLYQWDQSSWNAAEWGPYSAFEHDKLWRVLERVCLSNFLYARKVLPRERLAGFFGASDESALRYIHDHDLRQLEIPLYNAFDDESYIKLGASLLPIPSSLADTAAPSGILLVPEIQNAQTVQIPLGSGVVLALGGAFSAADAVKLSIFPGAAEFEIDPGLAEFAFGIELTGQPQEPWVLIGSRNSHRVEMGGFTLGVNMGGPLTDPEFTISMSTANPVVEGLDKIRVVVQFGEGDGFLQRVTSSDPIEFELGTVLSWSSKSGFAFQAQAGFEFSIPLHLSVGPFSLDTCYFALKGGNSSVDFALSAQLGLAITVNLGPLTAVIENMGVRVDLDFRENGNLGPADLAFNFKPPNGVGLAIDAGVIKGGGFLRFDPDKEEYDGMLELDLNSIVSVKAIALITTKMPDGSKGFSLLMIITAEFGSPIQLGLGFTLSGVGGLLGLNRTMRLEVIATGIRDGGINSIMFPQNVVANAPRIISDLKNYFPVEEGTFLIGPMVKIGWGTPNLVTVSLGVIIEIPGNIAILGVLKVALPDEDAALIVIQVNFMGAIEFDKERLWFFASIYESRILFITLEGDMGLLVGWGDNPNFVVSVGGFHPAFDPPVLPFGEIRRISISILNTDYARIIVQGYFAVTSNSVQFGASVELFFGVDAFNIDGHLAFDALFRFSPFYFIISISASLSVKVFGIGLISISMYGSLEGPSPWHIEGTGSISLLFFDIAVDFSHTWGEEEDTALPPILVMPLLEAEYQKLENWRAVLPNQSKLRVSLRSFEQGTDLILHPVGSLHVSQRAVPLGVTIDKIGNQKPSDANLFDLSVTTTGIGEQGEIDESFARGQYFSESDSGLLSAPAFEPLQGGVELSIEGSSLRAPKAVKRTVRYEKVIVDTHFRRYVSRFYQWAGVLFGVFLNGNTMSLATDSFRKKKQLKPFDKAIVVGTASYGVANVFDNSPFNGNMISFKSYAQAQEYLKQAVAVDPNLGKKLHVIPTVEMKQAA